MIENDDNESENSLPFSNDALNQNLLEININEELALKKPSICSNIFYFIFPCFKKVDTHKRRLVLFRNSPKNVTFYSNKEENHKYGALFFIPVVLFNQFKQFGNFFTYYSAFPNFLNLYKSAFYSLTSLPWASSSAFQCLKNYTTISNEGSKINK